MGKGILELLRERPVIGDGSCVFTLEKRGYVTAGKWTPEVVMEHPEAVRQLAKEFQFAGADVLQTCTFYGDDGRLQVADRVFTCKEINQAACDITFQVAKENDSLVCGSVSNTAAYSERKGKQAVQHELRKQCEVFVANKVHFVLAEYFGHIEEAVWAIEVMKELLQVPVACTMRIGPTGDIDNVSPADCAVAMATAGADIIGLNCVHDPDTCLQTMSMMKEGLQLQGLSPFLMIQPVGFNVPDYANVKNGYVNLPEFPHALESRQITRWQAARFARAAYQMGVHYIGGCCGWEPYHIRQMALELEPERGFGPPGKSKADPQKLDATNTVLSNKTSKQYWWDLEPTYGCNCRHK